MGWCRCQCATTAGPEAGGWPRPRTGSGAARNTRTSPGTVSPGLVKQDRDRVDGKIVLSSPEGGGLLVRIELPAVPRRSSRFDPCRARWENVADRVTQEDLGELVVGVADALHTMTVAPARAASPTARPRMHAERLPMANNKSAPVAIVRACCSTGGIERLAERIVADLRMPPHFSTADLSPAATLPGHVHVAGVAAVQAHRAEDGACNSITRLRSGFWCRRRCSA